MSQFVVTHARPATPPAELDRRPSGPLSTALNELVLILLLYLGLHFLLDLVLAATYLPRAFPVLLLSNPLLFFRYTILGSGGGLDFVVNTGLYLGSWIAAFAYGRRIALSFRACFGLFLIFYSVLRLVYGFLPDLQTVFTTGTVASAIPHAALYRLFVLTLFRNFVVPFFGVLLLFGALPFVQARGSQIVPKAARALERIGVARRKDALTDTMHGLWLFFFLFWGAVAVSRLAERTASTGDESQVFIQMTLDQVFLVSFAAGFGEEFYYRAVLMSLLAWFFVGRVVALRRIQPGLLGAVIVLQGLVFALAHSSYGNLAHVITPLAFGLFVGVVFLRFGFIPAFLIHFLIDVYAFGSAFAVPYPAVGFALYFFLFASAMVPLIYFLFHFLVWREREADFLGRIVVA